MGSAKKEKKNPKKGAEKLAPRNQKTQNTTETGAQGHMAVNGEAPATTEDAGRRRPQMLKEGTWMMMT